MKYQEALDYIESLPHGNVLEDASVRRLCGYLGSPRESLRFVHIVDADGKGSVFAFVSAILKCAGYRVGRYFSPVLFEYREKIRVNEKPITQKALCQGLDLIRDACEKMTAQGYPRPTSAEVETALAFWYFQEKKCDIVVLETGMGGLENDDNVIQVHTAAEGKKATRVRYGLERQRFDYGTYKNLEISLAGKFQIENAVLALEAVKILAAEGYPVKEEAVRQGLAQTQCQGEFSVIARKPLFVVDGACNEEEAERLSASVELYFADKRIIYIMGVRNDEEYEKLIGLTHKYADQIITVTPPHQGMAAYDLAVEVAKVHPQVTAVDSPEEAVEMSRLLAGKEDVILALGSLSYLGRLIQIVKKD